MATYSWVGGSASWASTLFWTNGGTSDGTVPGAADTAVIAAVGSYSIQAPGITVQSVTIADPQARLLVQGSGFTAGSAGVGGLANAGTISIGSGSTLQVAGSFAETGVITVGSGAAFLLLADSASAGLAGVSNAGGTVIRRDTLDNTGATLATASLGTLLLQGVVSGGTIASNGGTVSAGPGARFLNVALQGNFSAAGAGVSLDATSVLQPLAPAVSATLTLGAGAFTDSNPAVLDHVVLQGGASSVSLAGTLGPVGTINLAGTLGLPATQGIVSTTGGVLLLATALDNSGTIAAHGGTITATGSIVGSGTIAIGGAGTIELQKSYGQQVFQFLDNTGLLKLDFPAGAAPSTVLGFGTNATIELVANPATTLSLSGTTLTASNGGLTLARFVLPDMAAGMVYSETVDASNDTFIFAHAAPNGQPVTYTWAPVGGSTDWTAAASWSGNHGLGTPGTQAAAPARDTAILNNSGTVSYGLPLLQNVSLQFPTTPPTNFAEADFTNVELANFSAQPASYYGHNKLKFFGTDTLDGTGSIGGGGTIGALVYIIDLAADPAMPTVPAVFVNNGHIVGPLSVVNDGATIGTFINASTMVVGGVTDIPVVPFIPNLAPIGGTILIAATLSGTGSIDIQAGSGAVLLAAVGAGQTIGMQDFAANNRYSTYDTRAQLELGDPAHFAGRVMLSPKGTITLDNVVAAESYYANGTLGLSNGLTLRIDAPSSALYVTHNTTNTLIIAPCFAAGTRIATPFGEVAVEHLRPGDQVLTADFGRLTVVWIGHRAVDCARHPRPHDVCPVRVHRDAFGPGAPHRDLLLSPDHAVLADGVLIPVRYLINGATVVQEAAPSVVYFHVELAAHQVLLAEGLACESYLDTGNRSAFANGGATAMLHADFARAVWSARSCAELVTDGPRLAAVRRQLLGRAEAGGHAINAAPDLRVLADGGELDLCRDGRRHCCRIPPGTHRLRLQSRAGVPMHMQEAGTDARRLGVALAGLRLDGRGLGLNDPRLETGWHATEERWRWTDGDAVLAVSGASFLAFDIAVTGRYWRSALPVVANDAVRISALTRRSR